MATARAVKPSIQKKPLVPRETFAGKELQPDEYEERDIRTEDYASILLHFKDGARGVLTVSQVAAGRKNKKGFYDYPQNGPKRLWPGLTDLQNTKLDAEAIDIAELKHRLLAIRKIHQLCKLVDPTVDTEVDLAMRRIRRPSGRRAAPPGSSSRASRGSRRPSEGRVDPSLERGLGRGAALRSETPQGSEAAGRLGADLDFAKVALASHCQVEELSERHVLAREGSEHGLAHPRQHLAGARADQGVRARPHGGRRGPRRRPGCGRR